MYSRPSMDRKNRNNQGGSILIMAAITISTAIILLASIDIGFLFYQKRELQKVADLAALAGAQQLVHAISNNETSCDSTSANAVNNARANGFKGQVTAQCGQWTPQTPFSTGNNFSVSNAVSIQIEKIPDSFFSNSHRVHARAIATGSPTSPIAVFSVGSRLLRIENGVVPGLLSTLGLNIAQFDALSYKGLANTSITLGSLLKALGFTIPVSADIGTIKEIVSLNTNSGCGGGFCPLGELLGAIKAGDQDQLLDVNTLGLSVEQLALPVKLLTDETGRGIFSLLETANGKAALNANINALDLISTGVGTANNLHHKAINLSINPTGAISTLPTISKISTDIGIVEKPSIGIGGEGTKAYSSQVRLFTRIESNLLNANLIKADIPLSITLVNGEATLIELCKKKNNNNDVATISVNAPILEICLGDVTAAKTFSTSASCKENLSSYPALNVLGNNFPINKISLSLLTSGDTQDFVKGETKTLGSNNFALGTALTGILGKILGDILTGSQGNVTNQTLASGLLTYKGSVLNTTSGFLQDALSLLQIFANSLNTNADLLSLLGNTLSNLLNTAGGLVNGLVDGLSKLLTSVICLGNAQCILSAELSGNQGSSSISKVLLSIAGLLTNLLQPVLDELGSSIANMMSSLLGIQIGQVDVTLIDIQCGGKSDVRLVY